MRSSRLWGVPAAIAVVAVLSACGGSSKPSYCQQTASLKQSVQDLGSVNIVQGGTSALTSALSKVQTDASAVVSSAKSDFPNRDLRDHQLDRRAQEERPVTGLVAHPARGHRAGPRADQRGRQVDSGLLERHQIEVQLITTRSA